MRVSRSAGVAALLALVVFAVRRPSHASARITIAIDNAANEGFNDTTQAAPVGGNAGTTVGQQRLIAFKYAAAIWGASLSAPVAIAIRSTFTALTCDASMGVLGSAGPTLVYASPSGYPRPNVWYPGALANQFAGRDLTPATPPILAQFNSAIGGASCLTGTSWYYGLDGNTAVGQIDLVAVVLHEFAHGLGFLTLVDQSGQELPPQAGSPGMADAWEFSMFDSVAQKHWNEMVPAERQASATRPRKVAWDGLNVRSAVPNVLTGGTPSLTVSSPPSVAGEYMVGEAQFGPPLTSTGVSGNLVAAVDSRGSTTGCFAIPSPLRGAIALLDRGPAGAPCSFVTKVLNAQGAGASAVVIANNVSGSPPPPMGGTDPRITIPSVHVSKSDGDQLRGALQSGATVAVNEHLLPVLRGADDQNRALLYTPDQYKRGSSVVHTDTIATLLMDPAYNSALGHKLDLTPYLFQDIGWSVSDPNPADMSADIAISVIPPSNYKKGSSANYGITVTNNGPSDVPEAMLFSTLPSGVTFSSGTGECATGLPCTLGAISAGSSRSVTIALAIASSYSGGALQLTMNAAPPMPDPVLGNNVATISTPQSGGGCSSAGLGEPTMPAALLLLAMLRRRRSKV